MKYILLFFNLFLFAYDFPYDKFYSVLNNAKLQCPTSHYNPIYSRKKDFAGFANRYFYLDKYNNLVFYMCGNHKRSELRFKDEFSINSKKSLEFDVKLIPLGSEEFTFAQIYAKDFHKPFMRLAYKKAYRGFKNYIWAILRVKNKYYIKKALLPLKNRFLHFKIIIKNKTMYLFYENSEFSYNLSDINSYLYFKLGVYLQSNGCAKSIFKYIKRN